FVSSGTLISALASNTRSSSLMMPVLFFPVLVPVIISAVSGSQRALDFGIISAFDELKLLIAYSIIFIVIGYLSFDYIIEE
ncbi:MAG: heme exporter protein CcmB, partial [Thermoplasmata archaeon]